MKAFNYVVIASLLMLLSMSLVSAIPEPTDYVLYYKLNTFNATNASFVFDQSPNALHGQLKNYTWYPATNATTMTFGTGHDGMTNGSFVFNGSQSLNASNSSNFSIYPTNKTTISFWTKLNTSIIGDGSDGRTYFLSKGTMNGSSEYDLIRTNSSSGSNIALRLLSLDAAQVSLCYIRYSNGSNFNYTVGQWQHIAFVLNGTDCIPYLNGTPSTSITIARLNGTGNGSFMLGTKSGTNLNASMDDFRFYNRALSSAEVQTEYACPSHRPCVGNGLVASYDMMDYNATHILDTNNLVDGQVDAGNQFGVQNLSNRIDTPSSYIVSNITNNYTQNFWINLNSTAGMRFSSTSDYTVFYASDLITCDYVNATPLDQQNQVSYPKSYLNQWHMITCGFNGTHVNTYIDAVLINSTAFIGIPRSAITSTTFAARNTGTEPLNGSMDEIRLYNRTLSSKEVLALYYAGLNNNNFNLLTVTDKNYYDNVTLSNFTVTLKNGSSYTATDSELYTPVANNITTRENLTVSLAGYFNNYYTNYNVSTNLTASQWQSVIDVYLYDPIYGTGVNGSYAVVNQSNTTTGDLLVNAGTYLITATASGYQSQQIIFPVGVGQNRTAQFNMVATPGTPYTSSCFLMQSLVVFFLLAVILIIVFVIGSKMEVSSIVMLIIFIVLLFVGIAMSAALTPMICNL